MAGRRLGFWRRLAVVFLKSALLVFTRHEWRGEGYLPTDGGAIFVSNHISHIDPPVLAHFIYDAGRWPRFLAKSGLFRNPVLGFLLRKVRQIPVYRGTADAALALEKAIEVVNAGGTVVVYPEGTTTRDRDLWPMRGKTGIARLALATGAPVIPIVVWGTTDLYHPQRHKLRLRPRTPVTVVAGPPLDLTEWRERAAASPSPNGLLQEMTDAAMLRLREMLTEVRKAEPGEARQSGTGPAESGRTETAQAKTGRADAGQAGARDEPAP